MSPLLKSTRMTVPLFVLAASFSVPLTYAGERVMQPDYGVGTSPKAQDVGASHSDKKIRNTQSARRRGHEKWIDVMSYSWGRSASKVKIQGKKLLLKGKNNIVKRVMSGRYYLTDGRRVTVRGGRITEISRHNRTRTVGGNQTETVGANQSENVGGSRSERSGAKKQKTKSTPRMKGKKILEN